MIYHRLKKRKESSEKKQEEGPPMKQLIIHLKNPGSQNPHCLKTNSCSVYNVPQCSAELLYHLCCSMAVSVTVCVCGRFYVWLEMVGAVGEKF